MSLVSDINTVYKRLQGYSTGQCFLIPKRWCQALGWNKSTFFRGELLPARQVIILTRLNEEEASKLKGIKVKRINQDKEENGKETGDIVEFED